MIDVIPARPEMAGLLKLQQTQVMLGQLADERILAQMIQGGIALAVVEQGRVLALGGIVKLWEDRGAAWGLLSGDLGKAMPAIHRITLRGLEASPLRRVEAQVAVGHEAGQRWITMLGFTAEGRMRAYWQGQDYDLFARVR